MGKKAYQKIVETHQKNVFKNGEILLSLNKVFGHEITTPPTDVVFNPNRIKCMIDHISPAKDTASAKQGQIIRRWCQEHKIEFLDVGRNGICHAVIPEKGWILPGETAIMGDSHTCTMGAFGALTAGVGTTALGAGIITGLWLLSPQKVIRVNFYGKLRPHVFAKDLTLAYLRILGARGATNAILEFGGEVVKKLTMDERMTITNMAVEAGATSGMFPVDITTIDYLWSVISDKFRTKKAALKEYSKWNSDIDCVYDQVIEIDAGSLEPLIAKGKSPADVVEVKKIAEDIQAINQAFIGSCTNGRIEDLRIAAHILKIFPSGSSINKKTRCIIIPATQEIYKKALEEGLIQTFLEANCCVTNPNCGPCLGMSNGVLAPGEVCASTSNRNFPDRMGEGGQVFLASPATVALSAIFGRICQPEKWMFNGYRKGKVSQAIPTYWQERKFERPSYKDLSGEVVFVGPVCNKEYDISYLEKTDVDTDQIIPAKYLTEIDKEVFAKHCLEAAGLSTKDLKKIKNSQILVSLDNFGCGSSREQAVYALQGIGIKCVIAPSFARIFYENMFNCGLLCIKLPPEEIAKLLKKKPQVMIINWWTTEGNAGFLDWGQEHVNFPISSQEKSLVANGGLIGMMLKLAAQFNKE